MAIPEQVRRQSEAIAKMYEEGNTNEVSADTAAPAGDAVVQSTAADSEANAAPKSEPNEQRQPETNDGDNTFEQRYRTLQGMYNADTGRLRSENQQLNSRVTQLEQLLATMSAAPAPTASQPVETLVTEKDIEEYGRLMLCAALPVRK